MTRRTLLLDESRKRKRKRRKKGSSGGPPKYVRPPKFKPPFGLDPYLAVRNPRSLPILFRRGMYDVFMREKSGSLHDKFIKAFNIIAFGLTKSGRLAKGTVKLTGKGGQRESEVKSLPDTPLKLKWVEKWAQQIRRGSGDSEEGHLDEWERRPLLVVTERG